MVSLYIALLAALLSNGLLLSIPWLNRLELAVHQQQAINSPLPPNPEIVIVEITKDTPRKLGTPDHRLPLPRHFHAALIQALRQAGAYALVFDLLFVEPSTSKEDTALRQALSQSQPLHITLATEEQKTELAANAPGGWRYWFLTPVVLPHILPSNVIVASAKAFDPGATLDGAILLNRDEATQRSIPHLSLSAIMGRFRIEPSNVRWDNQRDEVIADTLMWPVGADGEVHAHWTARPKQFPAIDYADALAELQTQEGQNFFRHKIVLVGDVSGSDFHLTPLGKISGLEFVAHMVNTLLVPATLQEHRSTIPLNIVWCFFIALSVVAAVRSLRGVIITGGILIAVALAWVLPRSVYTHWNLWIDTVAPCVTIMLATTATGLYEGTRAKAQAQHFMPTHVRDVRPESLTEVATVLFVDLKGSTAMAEKLGPILAQEVLSDLLSQLTHIIHQHSGEVERTLGDGLMAVFRSRPDEEPSLSPLRCVQAIRELLRCVKIIGEKLRHEHGIEASLTIGFESGVISGAVVRAARYEEWSSFGPTVNLAARLQGACGQMQKNILFGPGAWALIHYHVPTEFLSAIPLKGIENPIPIYSFASDSKLTP